MESGILIKKFKINLLINLVLGLALLITGIIVELNDIQILDNNKIFVALSFIPLSFFIFYLIRIKYVRKHPEKYADEYDERLIEQRDRADAISLRIIRYLLWLSFLGYTFAKSAEVFESFAWWLLTILSLVTTFLPIILLGDVNKKYKPDSAK